MKIPAIIALGLVLAGGNALAQTAPADAAPTPGPAPAVPAATVEQEAWSGSVAAYFYFPPSNRDYVQPTIAADRGRLHLEARYNYEDMDTGSVWVGCNFSAGDTVALEFTPMLGGVFGNTSGIAPGYKGSLSWRKLMLYSEGEYMIDSSNSSDNFFYSWTELTWAPVEWLRVGLVTQHTRTYETEVDIQSGFLVGCSIQRLDITAYVFNPDARRPTGVLAFALNF